MRATVEGIAVERIGHALAAQSWGEAGKSAREQNEQAKSLVTHGLPAAQSLRQR